MSKAASKDHSSKSFDFKALLVDAGNLNDLERNTEFRLGSDDDLDRIISRTIHDICADDVGDHVVKLLGTLSVFGREFDSYKVFLSSDLPELDNTSKIYVGGIKRRFDKAAMSLGYRWRLAGFINTNSATIDEINFTVGGGIYSRRKDKQESAPDFLARVYKDELSVGKITLSELRKRDESLWRGLRNWAHAGNHDLDSIIPRGRSRPGNGNMALDFDPDSLDPNDPRDALVLRGLKVRESSRHASAAYRQRKRLQPS